MTSAANKRGTAKPLPTPEAIVFDCYDTLFRNPQSGWQAVVGEIAVDQNLPVDADDLYRTWKTLEVQFRGRRVNMVDPRLAPPFMSYEQAWAECFAETFRSMGLDGDPALAARRCVEHMATRPPYPETAAALESLGQTLHAGCVFQRRRRLSLAVARYNRYPVGRRRQQRIGTRLQADDGGVHPHRRTVGCKPVPHLVRW